jgi:hypothetical protein
VCGKIPDAIELADALQVETTCGRGIKRGGVFAASPTTSVSGRNPKE